MEEEGEEGGTVADRTAEGVVGAGSRAVTLRLLLEAL